ncbi:MAG: hypothetical protein HY547_07415 [Elusimicrobia bacterium]|nr:hypothetical protein [Elusimicrobiota bacterium]
MVKGVEDGFVPDLSGYRAFSEGLLFWKKPPKSLWYKSGPWLEYLVKKRGPYQGFKFHVSATPQNAARIADIATRILRRRGASHKIMASELFHELVESGFGDPQHGKLITVWPAGPQEAADLIREIDAALASEGLLNPDIGQKSQVLPPDFRWGRSGWLTWRYGQNRVEAQEGKPVFFEDGTPIEPGKNIGSHLRDASGHVIRDERGRSVSDNRDDPMININAMVQAGAFTPEERAALEQLGIDEAAPLRNDRADQTLLGAIPRFENVFAAVFRNSFAGEKQAREAYRLKWGPWLEEALFGLTPAVLAALLDFNFGWALALHGVSRGMFFWAHRGSSRAPPAIISAATLFIAAGMSLLAPGLPWLIYATLGLVHAGLNRFIHWYQIRTFKPGSPSPAARGESVGARQSREGLAGKQGPVFRLISRGNEVPQRQPLIKWPKLFRPFPGTDLLFVRSTPLKEKLKILWGVFFEALGRLYITLGLSLIGVVITGEILNGIAPYDGKVMDVAKDAVNLWIVASAAATYWIGRYLLNERKQNQRANIGLVGLFGFFGVTTAGLVAFLGLNQPEIALALSAVFAATALVLVFYKTPWVTGIRWRWMRWSYTASVFWERVKTKLSRSPAPAPQTPQHQGEPLAAAPQVQENVSVRPSVLSPAALQIPRPDDSVVAEIVQVFKSDNFRTIAAPSPIADSQSRPRRVSLVGHAESGRLILGKSADRLLAINHAVLDLEIETGQDNASIKNIAFPEPVGGQMKFSSQAKINLREATRQFNESLGRAGGDMPDAGGSGSFFGKAALIGAWITLGPPGFRIAQWARQGTLRALDALAALGAHDHKTIGRIRRISGTTSGGSRFLAEGMPSPWLQGLQDSLAFLKDRGIGVGFEEVVLVDHLPIGDGDALSVAGDFHEFVQWTQDRSLIIHRQAMEHLDEMARRQGLTLGDKLVQMLLHEHIEFGVGSKYAATHEQAVEMGFAPEIRMTAPEAQARYLEWFLDHQERVDTQIENAGLKRRYEAWYPEGYRPGQTIPKSASPLLADDRGAPEASRDVGWEIIQGEGTASSGGAAPSPQGRTTLRSVSETDAMEEYLRRHVMGRSVEEREGVLKDFQLWLKNHPRSMGRIARWWIGRFPSATTAELTGLIRMWSWGRLGKALQEGRLDMIIAAVERLTRASGDEEIQMKSFLATEIREAQDEHRFVSLLAAMASRSDLGPAAWLLTVMLIRHASKEGNFGEFYGLERARVFYRHLLQEARQHPAFRPFAGREIASVFVGTEAPERDAQREVLEGLAAMDEPTRQAIYRTFLDRWPQGVREPAPQASEMIVAEVGRRSGRQPEEVLRRLADVRQGSVSKREEAAPLLLSWLGLPKREPPAGGAQGPITFGLALLAAIILGLYSPAARAGMPGDSGVLLLSLGTLANPALLVVGAVGAVIFWVGLTPGRLYEAWYDLPIRLRDIYRNLGIDPNLVFKSGISPSQKFLFIEGPIGTRVYDIDRKIPVFEIPSTIPEIHGPTGETKNYGWHSAAISPDDSLAAVVYRSQTGKNGIKVFNRADGSEANYLALPETDLIREIHLLPGNDLVFVTYVNRPSQIWSLSNKIIFDVALEEADRFIGANKNSLTIQREHYFGWNTVTVAVRWPQIPSGASLQADDRNVASEPPAPKGSSSEDLTPGAESPLSNASRGSMGVRPDRPSSPIVPALTGIAPRGRGREFQVTRAMAILILAALAPVLIGAYAPTGFESGGFGLGIWVLSSAAAFIIGIIKPGQVDHRGNIIVRQDKTATPADQNAAPRKDLRESAVLQDVRLIKSLTPEESLEGWHEEALRRIAGFIQEQPYSLAVRKILEDRKFRRLVAALITDQGVDEIADGLQTPVNKLQEEMEKLLPLGALPTWEIALAHYVLRLVMGSAAGILFAFIFGVALLLTGGVVPMGGVLALVIVSAGFIAGFFGGKYTVGPRWSRYYQEYLSRYEAHQRDLRRPSWSLSLRAFGGAIASKVLPLMRLPRLLRSLAMTKRDDLGKNRALPTASVISTAESRAARAGDMGPAELALPRLSVTGEFLEKRRRFSLGFRLGEAWRGIRSWWKARTLTPDEKRLWAELRDYTGDLVRVLWYLKGNPYSALARKLTLNLRMRRKVSNFADERFFTSTKAYPNKHQELSQWLEEQLPIAALKNGSREKQLAIDRFEFYADHRDEFQRRMRWAFPRTRPAEGLRSLEVELQEAAQRAGFKLSWDDGVPKLSREIAASPAPQARPREGSLNEIASPGARNDEPGAGHLATGRTSAVDLGALSKSQRDEIKAARRYWARGAGPFAVVSPPDLGVVIEAVRRHPFSDDVYELAFDPGVRQGIEEAASSDKDVRALKQELDALFPLFPKQSNIRVQNILAHTSDIVLGLSAVGVVLGSIGALNIFIVTGKFADIAGLVIANYFLLMAFVVAVQLLRRVIGWSFDKQSLEAYLRQKKFFNFTDTPADLARYAQLLQEIPQARDTDKEIRPMPGNKDRSLALTKRGWLDLELAELQARLKKRAEGFGLEIEFPQGAMPVIQGRRMEKEGGEGGKDAAAVPLLRISWMAIDALHFDHRYFEQQFKFAGSTGEVEQIRNDLRERIKEQAMMEEGKFFAKPTELARLLAVYLLSYPPAQRERRLGGILNLARAAMRSGRIEAEQESYFDDLALAAKVVLEVEAEEVDAGSSGDMTLLGEAWPTRGRQGFSLGIAPMAIAAIVGVGLGAAPLHFSFLDFSFWAPGTAVSAAVAAGALLMGSVLGRKGGSRGPPLAQSGLPSNYARAKRAFDKALFGSEEYRTGKLKPAHEGEYYLHLTQEEGAALIKNKFLIGAGFSETGRDPLRQFRFGKYSFQQSVNFGQINSYLFELRDSLEDTEQALLLPGDRQKEGGYIARMRAREGQSYRFDEPEFIIDLTRGLKNQAWVFTMEPLALDQIEILIMHRGQTRWLPAEMALSNPEIETMAQFPVLKIVYGKALSVLRQAIDELLSRARDLGGYVKSRPIPIDRIALYREAANFDSVVVEIEALERSFPVDLNFLAPSQAVKLFQSADMWSQKIFEIELALSNYLERLEKSGGYSHPSILEQLRTFVKTTLIWASVDVEERLKGAGEDKEEDKEEADADMAAMLALQLQRQQEAGDARGAAITQQGLDVLEARGVRPAPEKMQEWASLQEASEAPRAYWGLRMLRWNWDQKGPGWSNLLLARKKNPRAGIPKELSLYSESQRLWDKDKLLVIAGILTAGAAADTLRQSGWEIEKVMGVDALTDLNHPEDFASIQRSLSRRGITLSAYWPVATTMAGVLGAFGAALIGAIFADILMFAAVIRFPRAPPVGRAESFQEPGSGGLGRKFDRGDEFPIELEWTLRGLGVEAGQVKRAVVSPDGRRGNEGIVTVQQYFSGARVSKIGPAPFVLLLFLLPFLLGASGSHGQGMLVAAGWAAVSLTVGLWGVIGVKDVEKDDDFETLGFKPFEIQDANEEFRDALATDVVAALRPGVENARTHLLTRQEIVKMPERLAAYLKVRLIKVEDLPPAEPLVRITDIRKGTMQILQTTYQSKPAILKIAATRLEPVNAYRAALAYSDFIDEVRGAQLFERLGIGPKFYGIVDLGNGRLAYLMEKVPGEVPQIMADRITQDVTARAVRMVNQIFDAGYAVGGAEFQVLIDANGVVRAIDPEYVDPLSRLPGLSDAARNQALLKFQQKLWSWRLEYLQREAAQGIMIFGRNIQSASYSRKELKAFARDFSKQLAWFILGDKDMQYQDYVFVPVDAALTAWFLKEGKVAVQEAQAMFPSNFSLLPGQRGPPALLALPARYFDQSGEKWIFAESVPLDQAKIWLAGANGFERLDQLIPLVDSGGAVKRDSVLKLTDSEIQRFGFERVIDDGKIIIRQTRAGATIPAHWIIPPEFKIRMLPSASSTPLATVKKFLAIIWAFGLALNSGAAWAQREGMAAASSWAQNPMIGIIAMGATALAGVFYWNWQRRAKKGVTYLHFTFRDLRVFLKRLFQPNVNSADVSLYPLKLGRHERHEALRSRIRDHLWQGLNSPYYGMAFARDGPQSGVLGPLERRGRDGLLPESQGALDNDFYRERLSFQEMAVLAEDVASGRATLKQALRQGDRVQEALASFANEARVGEAVSRRILTIIAHVEAAIGQSVKPKFEIDADGKVMALLRLEPLGKDAYWFTMPLVRSKGIKDPRNAPLLELQIKTLKQASERHVIGFQAALDDASRISQEQGFEWEDWEEIAGEDLTSVLTPILQPPEGHAPSRPVSGHNEPIDERTRRSPPLTQGEVQEAQPVFELPEESVEPLLDEYGEIEIDIEVGDSDSDQGPAMRLSGKGLTDFEHEQIVNKVIAEAFRQGLVREIGPDSPEYAFYDPDGVYQQGGDGPPIKVFLVEAPSVIASPGRSNPTQSLRGAQRRRNLIKESLIADLVVHAGRSRRQVYYFDLQHRRLEAFTPAQRGQIAAHEREHIKFPKESERQIQARAPLPRLAETPEDFIDQLDTARRIEALGQVMERLWPGIAPLMMKLGLLMLLGAGVIVWVVVHAGSSAFVGPVIVSLVFLYIAASFMVYEKIFVSSQEDAARAMGWRPPQIFLPKPQAKPSDLAAQAIHQLQEVPKQVDQGRRYDGNIMAYLKPVAALMKEATIPPPESLRGPAGAAAIPSRGNLFMRLLRQWLAMMGGERLEMTDSDSSDQEVPRDQILEILSLLAGDFWQPLLREKEAEFLLRFLRSPDPEIAQAARHALASMNQRFVPAGAEGGVKGNKASPVIKVLILAAIGLLISPAAQAAESAADFSAALQATTLGGGLLWILLSTVYAPLFMGAIFKPGPAPRSGGTPPRKDSSNLGSDKLTREPLPHRYARQGQSLVVVMAGMAALGLLLTFDPGPLAGVAAVEIFAVIIYSAVSFFRKAAGETIVRPWYGPGESRSLSPVTRKSASEAMARSSKKLSLGSRQARPLDPGMRILSLFLMSAMKSTIDFLGKYPNEGFARTLPISSSSSGETTRTNWLSMKARSNGKVLRPLRKALIKTFVSTTATIMSLPAHILYNLTNFFIGEPFGSGGNGFKKFFELVFPRIFIESTVELDLGIHGQAQDGPLQVFEADGKPKFSSTLHRRNYITGQTHSALSNPSLEATRSMPSVTAERRSPGLFVEAIERDRGVVFPAVSVEEFFSGAEAILDLGGVVSSGLEWTAGLARRWPKAQVTIINREKYAQAVAIKQQRGGLPRNIRWVEGDFFDPGLNIESADRMVMNSPYFGGLPDDASVERFVEMMDRFLEPGGLFYMQGDSYFIRPPVMSAGGRSSNKDLQRQFQILVNRLKVKFGAGNVSTQAIEDYKSYGWMDAVPEFYIQVRKPAGESNGVGNRNAPSKLLWRRIVMRIVFLTWAFAIPSIAMAGTLGMQGAALQSGWPLALGAAFLGVTIRWVALRDWVRALVRWNPLRDNVNSGGVTPVVPHVVGSAFPVVDADQFFAGVRRMIDLGGTAVWKKSWTSGLAQSLPEAHIVVVNNNEDALGSPRPGYKPPPNIVLHKADFLDPRQYESLEPGDRVVMNSPNFGGLADSRDMDRLIGAVDYLLEPGGIFYLQGDWLLLDGLAGKITDSQWIGLNRAYNEAMARRFDLLVRKFGERFGRENISTQKIESYGRYGSLAAKPIFFLQVRKGDGPSPSPQPYSLKGEGAKGLGEARALGAFSAVAADEESNYSGKEDLTGIPQLKGLLLRKHRTFLSRHTGEGWYRVPVRTWTPAFTGVTFHLRNLGLIGFLSYWALNHLGLAFYLTTVSFFILGWTHNEAYVGLVRGAYWAATILLSVPVGVWIGRIQLTQVMSRSVLILAVLLGAVPILLATVALPGLVPFWAAMSVFLGIVALSAMMQNTIKTASDSFWTRLVQSQAQSPSPQAGIEGGYEGARRRKLNSLKNALTYLASIAGTLAAGYWAAAVKPWWGDALANAVIGYGGYALFLLAASLAAKFLLPQPQQAQVLGIQTNNGPPGDSYTVDTAPRGPPQAHSAQAHSLPERWSVYFQGFHLIRQNPYLRNRLALSALNSFFTVEVFSRVLLPVYVAQLMRGAVLDYSALIFFLLTGFMLGSWSSGTRWGRQLRYRSVFGMSAAGQAIMATALLAALGLKLGMSLVLPVAILGMAFLTAPLKNVLETETQKVKERHSDAQMNQITATESMVNYVAVVLGISSFTLLLWTGGVAAAAVVSSLAFLGLAVVDLAGPRILGLKDQSVELWPVHQEESRRPWPAGPIKLVRPLSLGAYEVEKDGQRMVLRVLAHPDEASLMSAARETIQQAGIDNVRIPHIVGVTRKGEHPKNLPSEIKPSSDPEKWRYLLIEKMPGRSWASLLQATDEELATLGYLPIGAHDRTGLQRAVSAMRRQGLAHGDLKPANILIHQEGGRTYFTLIDWEWGQKEAGHVALAQDIEDARALDRIIDRK